MIKKLIPLSWVIAVIAIITPFVFIATFVFLGNITSTNSYSEADVEQYSQGAYDSCDLMLMATEATQKDREEICTKAVNALVDDPNSL